MDHFVSLVVLGCFVAASIRFERLYAKARFGNVEFEIRAERGKGQKEEPGSHRTSSQNQKPLE